MLYCVSQLPLDNVDSTISQAAMKTEIKHTDILYVYDYIYYA